MLQAASAGPPADPGQLAWLNAGLAALADTGLAERDKLAAVMAVLHFVRGAAALDIEAGPRRPARTTPALLRRFVDADRFPALAAAVEAGVFDDADDDHLAEFRSGLGQLLDGIAAKIAAVNCEMSVTTSRLAYDGAKPAGGQPCRKIAGGSMPSVATSKAQTISYPHPAHVPAVMTTLRSTRTWSCCSARRATWPDAS